METITDEHPTVAEGDGQQAGSGPPVTEPTQPLPPRRSALAAAIKTARPHEWIKNLLVFAGLLFGGKFNEPTAVLQATVAFVAFCAISSAGYFVNDLNDVELDRRHPKKRFRPIAAGELKPATALALAVVLGLCGLALGFVVSVPLGITMVVYVAIQLLYSAYLKHLPVVDLAVVASAFLLRAIAGGVATDIPLSQWFLLVAAFGSFFMVSGKRYSEMKALGSDAGTRRSLTRYSESYLRFAWMMAAVMVLISYSLWAFENRGDGALGIPWTAISIAPFTLGLLQYALEVDAGTAGEPEDVVLHDHVLQGLGVVWLAVITVGVFF